MSVIPFASEGAFRKGGRGKLLRKEVIKRVPKGCFKQRKKSIVEKEERENLLCRKGR